MAQPQTAATEAPFLAAFEAHAPLRLAALPGTNVDLFSLETALARLDELSALLSETEHARAAAIAHPGRRTAHIASRGLLRTALTEAAQGVVPPTAWRFGTSALGKPHVTSPQGIGMRFSLSYTPALIAIAISQRFELGVDIEAVPTAPTEVPWQVLTPAERQFIRTLPKAGQFTEFLNIWTIKEAYTKYLGVGASLDFRKVEVSTHLDRESAHSGAETRLPEPMVKQRQLVVGREAVIVAVAAGKPASGTFVAPAGESVALLHRL